MYVLVLEEADFQVLIDPADLWRVPRVIVRRGYNEAGVWLDDSAVAFIKPSRFSVRDQVQILALVRDNVDHLLDRWASLKDDVRKGRLEEYNVLID